MTVSRHDTIPQALESRQAEAAVCRRTAEPFAQETPAANLDEVAISALIRFFQVLDQWDREAKKQ